MIRSCSWSLSRACKKTPAAWLPTRAPTTKPLPHDGGSRPTPPHVAKHSTPYNKARHPLQRHFAQGDLGNLCRCWPLLQPSRQFLHGVCLALKQHLNPAVLQVAYPAIKIQALSLLIGVLPIRHALHPTTNQGMPTYARHQCSPSCNCAKRACNPAAVCSPSKRSRNTPSGPTI